MNFAGGMILSVLLLAIVSGATFSGEQPAHATVPGKNGRIIFVGHYLGNPEYGIYTINPDGSDARMISGYGRELGGPSDRGEIIGATGDSRFFILSADGTEKRLVYVGGTHPPDQPALSPDGDLIAWYASASGHSAIGVVNSTSGEMRGGG